MQISNLFYDISMSRYRAVFVWRIALVVSLILLFQLLVSSNNGTFFDKQSVLLSYSNAAHGGNVTQGMTDESFKLEMASRRQRIQSVCQNFMADKIKLLEIDNSVAKALLSGYSIIHHVDWDSVLDIRDQKQPDGLKLSTMKFYVVPMFKWMFCGAPKVGSRNIIRYFLQLTNPSLTLEEIESLKPHNRDKYKYDGVFSLHDVAKNSTQEALRVIKTYKKFVFVRNPLDRLLSAWNDKLYSRNDAYAEVIGWKIIKRFRTNATSEEIKKGYPVSLDEFFRSLRYANDILMDVHWMPLHRESLMCAIDYDFIGKLENVEFELPYLAKQMTDRADIPKFLETEIININRTDYNVDRYAVLRKVSRSLVEDVLKRHYQIDYDLFGYSIVEDLDKVYGRK